MTTADQDLIKSFLQCPNVLLYGRPDLAIQDKWSLISLMGLCWDRYRVGRTLKELEGPYKLSLREISSITGVKHTALRRKEGKEPRDGVLDRLQAVGYVTAVDGKPIDQVTGKEGRAQTYLYIHLEKIWIENSIFTKDGRLPENRLVSEASFKVVDDDTVNVVNSPESPVIVNVVNSTVSYVNSDVNQDNSHVNVVNHTVNGASSNSAQYSNTLNTKEDRSKTVQSHQKIPYFIKSAIRKQSCLRGETERVDENIAYTVQIYEVSGLDRETFEQLLNQAVTETDGGNMDDLFDCLCRLAGVQVTGTQEVQA